MLSTRILRIFAVTRVHVRATYRMKCTSVLTHNSLNVSHRESICKERLTNGCHEESNDYASLFILLFLDNGHSRLMNSYR